jgi:ABC-2 type transport system ATP-binding protein
LLIADDLQKKYGDNQALKGVSMQVRPGEIYALLGPNGAGKTTTINCFLGLVRPEGGTAVVGGINTARDPLRARKRMAYIPEQVNLYPHFTGMENLAYFTEINGKKYSRPQYEAFLQQAGLQDFAFNLPVKDYSKGMRQKVGIAIAVAKEAKALLLDEPTSGLDPRASREFADLISRLKADGVAVLMATHDLFRARDIATRVGIMLSGLLVREVDAAEITDADLIAMYLEVTKPD